jgi:hypothetical protein
MCWLDIVLLNPRGSYAPPANALAGVEEGCLVSMLGGSCRIPGILNRITRSGGNMDIKKANEQEWRVRKDEAIKIQRRVLKMLDRHLAKQPQLVLVTDGKSLMTWRELREHITGALKLKIVG